MVTKKIVVCRGLLVYMWVDVLVFAGLPLNSSSEPEIGYLSSDSYFQRTLLSPGGDWGQYLNYESFPGRNQEMLGF